MDTFGKEELLVALAVRLKTKIIVSAQRFQLLELCESVPLSLFSTSSNDGFIRVTAKKDVSVAKYLALSFLNIFFLLLTANVVSLLGIRASPL